MNGRGQQTEGDETGKRGRLEGLGGGGMGGRGWEWKGHDRCRGDGRLGP